MSMIFRYPDDPMRVSDDFLKKLEDKSKPGDLIVQYKWDDWRLMASKDSGAWHFFAKRGGKEDRAKKPPDHLVRQLEALEIPDGTCLDMGWVGPRDPYKVLNGKHFFVVWDLMYWNFQWQGGSPYKDRLKFLSVVLATHKARTKSPTDMIEIVQSNPLSPVAMFEESKKHPEYEGVVVKKAMSKLLGGFSKADDNPGWYKVKYRDIKEATAF